MWLLKVTNGFSVMAEATDDPLLKWVTLSKGEKSKFQRNASP